MMDLYSNKIPSSISAPSLRLSLCLSYTLARTQNEQKTSEEKSRSDFKLPSYSFFDLCCLNEKRIEVEDKNTSSTIETQGERERTVKHFFILLFMFCFCLVLVVLKER
jgi:hypothetical protein